MSDERIEAIPTRWSLIRQAHEVGAGMNQAEARRLLVLRYSSAIRRYLGAMLRDDDRADELAQDMLMRLMRGDFAGADPTRGRFRDLLKTAIRNMARNNWEKEKRRKPTEAELDLYADKSFEAQDAEWTRAWQKTVLDHTWNRMQSQKGNEPNPAYEVLRLRAAHPDASSEELAILLGKVLKKEVKPDSCRQILKRARRTFAEHLLDEIRAGLDDEAEDRLQDELASLGLLELVREYLPEVESGD